MPVAFLQLYRTTAITPPRHFFVVPAMAKGDAVLRGFSLKTARWTH
jgi:hypothetical protein